VKLAVIPLIRGTLDLETPVILQYLYVRGEDLSQRAFGPFDSDLVRLDGDFDAGRQGYRCFAYP
jgi:hypothetical protein